MKDRVAAIDGMRAIACLSVMAFHAELPFTSLGWLGVDVFFVLSGYLTGLQLGGGAHAGSWFYRRLARLWPALLCMVLVVSPVALFGGGSRSAYLAAALYCFTPGLFAGDAMLVAHTWSLTVEMRFYLAAALAFATARLRLLSSPGVSALLALAVASFVTRIVYTLAGHGGYAANATESRLDGLLVGLAIGTLTVRGRRVWLIPHPGVWGALLAAAAVAGFELVVPTLATGLAAALVLQSGDSRRLLTRVLSTAPLRALGARTYSLYLWHLPAFALVRFHTPLSGAGAVTAEFVLAGMLAESSYRLVETPARKWLYTRDPFRRRPTGHASARTVAGTGSVERSPSSGRTA